MDVREKLIDLLTGHSIDTQQDVEYVADHLIANGVTMQENVEISDELLKQLKNAPITICKEEPSIELVQEWISVDEKLPQNFISVLGYMTDAGEFPPVRECYTVGNVFFFPALGGIHPVSHWREMPQPPKGE
jgi:hypothetical protein